MDYSKLNRAIGNAGMTVLQLAESIGMSEAGYYKMVRVNSIKVGTLEKISEVLGVPMSYWFDNTKFASPDKDLEEKYKELLEENRYLNKLLREKDDKIKELEQPPESFSKGDGTLPKSRKAAV